MVELTKRELHAIFGLLVSEKLKKIAELDDYTADEPYPNSIEAMTDYPKYDPEKYNEIKSEYETLRSASDKIDQALKDAYAK